MEKKKTAYVHSPPWKLLAAIVKVNSLFIYPIEMEKVYNIFMLRRAVALGAV